MKIATAYTSTKEELTTYILKRLLKVSNFHQKEVCVEDLNPVHLYKLSTAISLNEKISIILPAFPAKSGNRNKTFSHLPDLGEVEALKRLNSMAKDISDRYLPGIEIVICSDGRVFSDLVGVTEEEVSIYKNELSELIREFKLKYIKLFDLEDVYSSKLNFDQMRYQLEREHSKSIESVKENLKKCDNALTMFNGIHRFIKEDYLVLKKDLSKNQISKVSKNVAYKVIQRSNAWSTLVESKFPNSLRLSIHPQDAFSEKFPIKLIPSDESWGTPWHRVAVIKNGDLRLMRAIDIKDLGGKLKKYFDKYVYFELSAEA